MEGKSDIHSYVTDPGSLSEKKREEMFQLMNYYFDNLNRKAFDDDLNEKHWVICIEDKTSAVICGFSTLQLMETVLDKRKIKAFFSGDTIIHRDYWGNMLLEKEWLNLVFTEVRSNPSAEWYWFLICKGYRTYRYLPVYFKNYYPASGVKMKQKEKEVLDTLGRGRFHEAYDSTNGVIRSLNDYRLKPGVGDITEELLEDPRIAFFQKMNPEWRNGDELACLVRLEESNLKRQLRI